MGALGALWPWQKTGEILYTKASGEEKYEMLNVLPSCSINEIIFVIAFTALEQHLLLIWMNFLSDEEAGVYRTSS